MPPISSQLNSFSPLAQAAFLKNLGLEDKNHNGVIDKNAGEGYEEFLERYGDADIGIAANGVTYGAANGRLEEPEIINHYYLNIRFKEPAETATIENEVSAYIYANNIPLVWLDDEQGTVMNAINKVLGEGWNEQEVTEDEAVRMFQRAMDGMRIRGRTGTPRQNGGYYTLSEFVTKKSGYCFEAAQFGFFMASELKLNSLVATTPITSDILHEVLMFTKSTNVYDHFLTAPTNANWRLENPIQSISYALRIEAERTSRTNAGNAIKLYSQSAIYNKYDITTTAFLMQSLIFSTHMDYTEDIIIIGKAILANISIDNIMQTNNIESNKIKHNLKLILFYLLMANQKLGNQDGIKEAILLLKQYFGQDKEAQDFINDYT
jgi:hypothetical protein